MLGHMLLNPYRVIAVVCRRGQADCWQVDWRGREEQWPFELLPCLVNRLGWSWDAKPRVRMHLCQFGFKFVDWDKCELEATPLNSVQVWPSPPAAAARPPPSKSGGASAAASALKALSARIAAFGRVAEPASAPAARATTARAGAANAAYADADHDGDEDEHNEVTDEVDSADVDVDEIMSLLVSDQQDSDAAAINPPAPSPVPAAAANAGGPPAPPPHPAGEFRSTRRTKSLCLVPWAMMLTASFESGSTTFTSRHASCRMASTWPGSVMKLANCGPFLDLGGSFGAQKTMRKPYVPSIMMR